MIRDNDFGYTVINLNVLPGIDTYRFYHYFSPDEVEEKNYNVKDQNFVLIKFKPTEYSVGYISPIISGIEEKSQFLFVTEKVYNLNKWKVRILNS